MPKTTAIAKRQEVSEELWARIQNDVENKPEVSLAEIAKQYNVPVTTLTSRATRNNWLEKRDLANLRKAETNIKRFIREVALQVNDLHQHASAMIEALQYSHRIKIVKDDNGALHYVNFEDWPDKPANWDELDDVEKNAYRRYISPPRLKSFMADLLQVTAMKSNTINFVTKVTKAALPKVDPSYIDILRRDGDDVIMDKSNIFTADLAQAPPAGTIQSVKDALQGGRKIKSLKELLEEHEEEEDNE
jgi:ribosomal protein S25